MAVFTSGVPSDASNGPCEKKCAGTTSQLFQKKRLCVNPYIADIEQQQQLKQQHQEEEDGQQHSDSKFGLLHDDDSDFVAGSPGHAIYKDTGEPDPELYCSHENEDYNTSTVSQKSVVNLLYLLNKMEAPDYVFQSIMEWAHECLHEGFDFNPCMTQKANIAWMYNSIHNAKHMLPFPWTIKLLDALPNMETMDVICYDFVAQLLSILQCGRMSNMLLVFYGASFAFLSTGFIRKSVPTPELFTFDLIHFIALAPWFPIWQSLKRSFSSLLALASVALMVSSSSLASSPIAPPSIEAHLAAAGISC